MKAMYVTVALLFVLAVPTLPAQSLEVRDNGDGTYTILPDAAEATVIARALQEHSSTILKEVLAGWLRGETAMFLQRDKDAQRDRFMRLDPATQRKIMNLLQCGLDVCP